MNIVGIDWAGKSKKLAIVYRDSSGVLVSEHPKDLESVISSYHNSIFLIENTFDSFKLEQAKYQKLAEVVGSKFWIFKSRQTDRWRKRLNMVKTDEGDAHLLYHLWENKLGSFRELKDYNLTKFHNDGLYDEFQNKLVDLRVEGYKDKEEKYLPYLPNPDKMPDFAKLVFGGKAVTRGDRKGQVDFKDTPLYTALVAAVGVVENCRNRDDFDRCISMTIWRRKSIFSSNIYYHTIKWLYYKSLGISNKNLEKLNEIDEETKMRVHKDCSRLVRKAMRWMFHHVKKVYGMGTCNPNTGHPLSLP